MNAALFETTPAAPPRRVGDDAPRAPAAVPLRDELPSPHDDVDQQAAARVAMILSGGGARGAYEVGVLWYIFDDLTRILGAPPRIDILCGTSVGAINALLPGRAPGRSRCSGCAASSSSGASSSSRACSASACARSSRCRACCSAGGEGYGLFDVRPMADLVQREISWRAVSRCLRQRHAARAHRLVHRGVDGPHRRLHADRRRTSRSRRPRRRARSSAPTASARTTRSRAPRSRCSSRPCASTASCTSTAASARTRPSRPRCASARRTSSPSAARARCRGASCARPGTSETTRAPGAAFLLGKVLNAFLLDHVDVDIELLTRINSVLVDGTRAYGAGFTEALSAEARKRGALEYRHVQLHARPPQRGHRPARRTST